MKLVFIHRKTRTPSSERFCRRDLKFTFVILYTRENKLLIFIPVGRIQRIHAFLIPIYAFVDIYYDFYPLVSIPYNNGYTVKRVYSFLYI